MPLFKIFTFDMPNLESKCEGLLQSCFSNGGAAHKKYGKLPFLTTFSKILGTATFFNRFERNSKLKLLRSKQLKVLSFVKISQKLWELQQMKVCNTLTAHLVYWYLENDLTGLKPEVMLLLRSVKVLLYHHEI